MMGKFPNNPTESELRTALGFRIAGIFAFLLLATWRAWMGDAAGAGVIVLLIIVLSAVFIVPRASQLRKMRMEKNEGHED